MIDRLPTGVLVTVFDIVNTVSNTFVPHSQMNSTECKNIMCDVFYVAVCIPTGVLGNINTVTNAFAPPFDTNATSQGNAQEHN